MLKRNVDRQRHIIKIDVLDNHVKKTVSFLIIVERLQSFGGDPICPKEDVQRSTSRCARRSFVLFPIFPATVFHHFSLDVVSFRHKEQEQVRLQSLARCLRRHLYKDLLRPRWKQYVSMLEWLPYIAFHHGQIASLI